MWQLPAPYTEPCSTSTSRRCSTSSSLSSSMTGGLNLVASVFECDGRRPAGGAPPCLDLEAEQASQEAHQQRCDYCGDEHREHLQGLVVYRMRRPERALHLRQASLPTGRSTWHAFVHTALA